MRVKTEAKRQAILDTATEVFREKGYENTSMSEICSRVGGSKATLYNYFASKDELFFAVMTSSCQADFEAAHQAIDATTDDIDEALRNFGEKFLGFLYSPEVQANRRMTIVASGHGEIGRLVYEREVLRSQKLVADFLLSAMEKGRLRRADPYLAARQLHSLLEAELIEPFLFQLLGEVGAEEIKNITARALEVFMAAYGRESAS